MKQYGNMIVALLGYKCFHNYPGNNRMTSFSEWQYGVNCLKQMALIENCQHGVALYTSYFGMYGHISRWGTSQPNSPSHSKVCNA